VDLEAEVTTLQEDADANDIERLTLLQNIVVMQQQVEEAKVQVATLQAIVALQPLPPVQAPPEEQQVSYGPPWAHYLGGYQDRLLGGPLGLLNLGCTTPVSVEHKDLDGEVLG
jgi:hypothetical protein